MESYLQLHSSPAGTVAWAGYESMCRVKVIRDCDLRYIYDYDLPSVRQLRCMNHCIEKELDGELICSGDKAPLTQKLLWKKSSGSNGLHLR